MIVVIVLNAVLEAPVVDLVVEVVVGLVVVDWLVGMGRDQYHDGERWGDYLG